MLNINFAYPWLLLLLIPAVGLAFIPYFRISKKYRRTRNRILSLVLHCVGIVCVTLALSGMVITHSEPNTSNEVILLIDVSNTQQQSADARDDYVYDIISESARNNFTVGVITFGYDQVYAVPLTTDTGSVYSAYLSATKPDISATDYESALTFAMDKFSHPETGKIILITDGKETDGNVTSSLMGKIISNGIKVDTVYVSSAYNDSEVQLISVDTPDYYVKTGAECSLNVNILAKQAGFVKIKMYDNDKLASFADGIDGASVGYFETKVTEGVQTVSVPYTFAEDGMHHLKFEVEVSANGELTDTLNHNNIYFTHVDIEVFKKVLIIEKYNGESDKLVSTLRDVNTLGEDGLYDVSVYNLTDETLMHYTGEQPEEGETPKTIDDFRAYYQIILNNVSNSDLVNRENPLDNLIYTYVYQYGGGVLTVGGNDPVTGEAHMYDRKDMYDTKYQQMLPVEAVDYTPPLGVFIIVDTSGSMTDPNATIGGETPLYWAKVGAAASLNALSERDYIGIMTLGSIYSDILPLTPRTKENEIKEAINQIEEANSGTIFTDSVLHAAQQLRAAQVEKRHIIIVSDGLIGDQEQQNCVNVVKQLYQADGLTVSCIVIGDESKAKVKDIVLASREEGWDLSQPGSGYYVLDSTHADSIAEYMIKDLSVDEIKAVNAEEFKPTVSNKLSQVVQNLEIEGNRLTVTLGGYYGTKIKPETIENDGLILVGSCQVPIYARWKFGNGNVGSFMCDLKGDADAWSAQLMESIQGKQLIYNMVDNLMPISDITPKELSVDITNKNYGNHLNRYGTLKDGETIKGRIITPDGVEISLNSTGGNADCYVTRALSESNRFSICDFVVLQGGTYRIEIDKLDSSGKVLSTLTTYKEFSYSSEYDANDDRTEGELTTYLKNLSKDGKGIFVEEIDDIFLNADTTIRWVFDCRWLLIITAMVLFLIDIAVRKFKFKWIHEIIRDRKEKRQAKTGGRHEGR